MKKLIAILAIFACATIAQAQSNYQPFRTDNPQKNLGTPRSFEQPRQPVRQYHPPPDVNIQIRPGYGNTPRAFDMNTGYPLNVRPRSLGGYDISTD
jgi:hypothetical protein